MMRNALRRSLPWLLLVLVALAAAWLRYGLIEPSAIVQFCARRGSPLWCSARQWLVLGFLHDVYGVAALLAAAAALLSRRPGLAWLAAAVGAFALELYCFEAGALALLLGSLRLLRLQAQTLSRLPPGAPPAEQHRQREREIASQP